MKPQKQSTTATTKSSGAQSSGVRSVFRRERKFWIASVLLHCVLLVVLAFSWSFDDAPEVVVPKYLEARVATEADLAPLKEKRAAEELARKKELERQRLAAEKKKRLEDLQRKNKEEARRKKAAQEKAEREKALIAKRKQEEKRKEDEKRRQEEQRKREAQEKLRAEQQERENQRKAAEAKRLEEQREAREQALAERLAAAELEAQQRRDLLAQQVEQAAFEASETERYLGLIKRKIENRWRKPPNVKGVSVILSIRLLPTGELTAVSIKESSGSSALDQSALVAVRSVKRFPVPETTSLFEKNFRSFDMKFTP